MKLSIVIPLFNEEKSLKELHESLSLVLAGFKYDYEIIFIDDGSTDNSFSILKNLRCQDQRIKIILFRKNFGQTAALDAGFKLASGEIIITMDADLQNDPRDIPKLISKTEEGFDCVSGWRVNRKDPILKKILSRCANILRHFLINDKINDSGCTLKAYKKECFESLELYGEMHRFIPALLKIQGFKIGEVEVNHLPRKYGVTKYNTIRVLKGFTDILNVWFWQKYSSRPLHLFGGVGIFSGCLGFIIGLYLVVIKFAFNQSIANRPLLFLSILLIILGAQFLVFGILADMIIRIYYKRDKNYKIKQIIQ